MTERTRGLLDRRRIGLLPRGAGVVNVGRGGLVEQDALLGALDAGRLGGAVLDVVTPEPVPPGHRLWRTANPVMTPHMSSDGPETYVARSLDIFFADLAAHARGRRRTAATWRAATEGACCRRVRPFPDLCRRRPDARPWPAGGRRPRGGGCEKPPPVRLGRVART